MEYLPLGDMQSHLLDQGRVPEGDAKDITRQILRGLQFMHSNRSVHRDLKPANILIKSRPLTGPWWVKIADFGLSKTIEKSRSLTSTACGTLGFIAPEILGLNVRGGGARKLSGLQKAKAADMWALGETVFQILTCTSSFQGDMQRLVDYVQGRASFPDSALHDAGVSRDGISFIHDCMDPHPWSRPSPNYAVEGLAWQANIYNCYDGWEATEAGTLQCKGTDPPFLLFTPTGDHLIVITRHKIYLWNVKTMKVDSTRPSSQGHEWVHGSVQGRYLCVTQADASQPPEILDICTLDLIESPDDGLEYATAPKISTFSHDGKWLVIATGTLLSHISVCNGWAVVNVYQGAISPSSGSPMAGGIRSLAFTRDRKRLVTANEHMVVIRDTSSSLWRTVQVFEYPCPLNTVSVSLCGTMVACGSSTGVIWLWTFDTNCWKRRLMYSRGPDKTGRPIENLEFSETGLSMTFTSGEDIRLSLAKTVPLNKIGFSRDIYRPCGHQVGRTVNVPKHMYGATPSVERSAYATKGLAARVTIWRYKT